MHHPLAPHPISTDKADMAQITSREELQEWLKDKPADWAQVVAVRAALRVLPSAFAHDSNDSHKWMNANAIAFFRAVALPLIAFDFPDRDMSETIKWAGRYLAASGAHSHAYGAIDQATMVFTSTETMLGGKFQNIISFAGSTIDFEIQSLGGDSARVWLIVSEDCDALERDDDPTNAACRLRNNSLTTQLGFDRVGEWASVSKHLYALDPTYEVWLNFYDRRILGEVGVFDIPGDSDRIEEKKILAALTNASSILFWDKGATYVNTTLQSWIDEARERAVIDYVASGAPLKLGSDAELAARDELAARLASVEDALTALMDQLASLTQTEHGGIGHNQPENATSLRDDEIITLKQQVASLETLLTGVQTQLAIPVPDVGQLVQDVPKLNRWGRAMCVMADMSSDKVAEGFEKEIGAASARGLINVGKALVYTALCAFLLFFYTVWIPLLIG